MIKQGQSINKTEYIDALRSQELYCEILDKMFCSYDMVLSLSTASSAPLREVEELPDPSLIWTLGHLPAISAPVFKSPEGMPFGAQFTSRRGNDYLLLEGVEMLIRRGLLPEGSQKIIEKYE
jgi:Asp-tRNA(Asn)/Glu-tRNA(Gln) amidotransferase A subunit family amidase